MAISHVLLVVWLASIGVSPDSEAFFESHIRPVLLESCLDCHGAVQQEAELRLDSAAGLSRGGKHGPVIDWDHPEQSKLLAAIDYQSEPQMPPAGRLPQASINALRAWVIAGAKWPTVPVVKETHTRPAARDSHWALRPIVGQPPPKLKSTEWASSAIDLFVLEKQNAAGIRPSGPADRLTLLRRASYGLTGLPPSEEEAAAFLADPAPTLTAFAKVVNRLLASPHYGEKWAQHWLDLARYADTKGFVKQNATREEELYPNAFTYRDYVIGALNRDLPFNQFIVEQLAADQLPGEDPSRLAALGFLTVGRRFRDDLDSIIDDRIDLVGRGLLGLTLACARCHDHKYDPIPTEDYYSLYGVFANSYEPVKPPPVVADTSVPAGAAFQREWNALETSVRGALQRARAGLQLEWARRLPEYLSAARQLPPQSLAAPIQSLARQRGLSERLLILFHHRWHQAAQDPHSKDHRVFGLLLRSFALADGEGDRATGLSGLRADGRWNSIARKGLESCRAADPDDVAKFVSTLANDASSPSVAVSGEARELHDFFHAPGGLLHLSDAEVKQACDRETAAAIERLRQDQDHLLETHPGAPPRAMAIYDYSSIALPVVFVRGDPTRRGQRVPLQAPFMLTGEPRRPFQIGSGRLELAKTIASESNPLTPRVLVNRVWAMHFGAGLVKTLDDFGSRAEKPSHPELLDYLAGEFVRKGWSLKQLHRDIMLSSVYAQASADRPECHRIDPENALLWRFAPRRLSLEDLRDSLLVAAGRLDRSIGGPSFDFNKSPWSGRRTLYAFVDRKNFDPLMRAFDVADPNIPASWRRETMVPQQALYFFNSPFVLDMSEDLSRASESAGGPTFDERARWIYRRVFGRPPTASEVELSRAFLGDAVNDKASARAWRQYVQVLFMSPEFSMLR